MTASNLAVCFAPSLFYFPESLVPLTRGRLSIGKGKYLRRSTGIPDLKELLRQKAAQQCLSDLILYWKEMFQIDLNEIPFLRYSAQTFAGGRQWMFNSTMPTMPTAPQPGLSQTPQMLAKFPQNKYLNINSQIERGRANSVQSNISGLFGGELTVPLTALRSDRLSCDDFLAHSNSSAENLTADSCIRLILSFIF